MAANNTPERRDGSDYWFAVGLFIAALAFHAWGAFVGWSGLNLPGCEFRQTQTAISALFIQREHNFSLAYPTPVLGQPWSIPMEFPLYQWTVVVVADALKMSLTHAGRAVSLACFYLALPALYGLLGRIGLAQPRRLLALGLVLTCPLYIYYARAFLIETMALMFGAWFLLAYVRAVERRRVGWLVLAGIAGTGCGLVKVTTLFFFLAPAFFWTLWWLGQDLRQPAPLGKIARRAAWCALAVVLPFAVLHLVGALFGRDQGSFRGRPVSDLRPADGDTTSAPACVSRSRSVATALAGVIPGPDFGRRDCAGYFADRAVCAEMVELDWYAGVLFFAVQVVHPILYAWHEYYYVASGFTLMLAYGLALAGTFESRLPQGAVWILVLVLYGLQVGNYLVYFYPSQRAISNGGSNLTLALRRVVAPDEVMVIVGDDWSSITPYYAERRALMIRRNLEHNWDIITPAFEQLKGEEVTALIMYGEQVRNQTLIDHAVKYFRIDPRPAFRWRDATVWRLHEALSTRDARVAAKYPGRGSAGRRPPGKKSTLRPRNRGEQRLAAF